jgi:chaperonin GroES
MEAIMAKHGRAKAKAMFRPLHDYVLLRFLPAEARTPIGVIIPDAARQATGRAEVIAVGPGSRTRRGVLVRPPVTPGDQVLVSPDVATEVKLGGSAFSIVKARDISGIIETAREPTRPTATAEIGAGRAGADAVPYDEPAPVGAEESPETDVAPKILEHEVSDRAESLETDAAPPVVDRGVPPAAGLSTPETCSELDRDHVTAEDLH